MIFQNRLRGKGMKVKVRKNMKVHYKQRITDKIIREIIEANSAKVLIEDISLSPEEWAYFCRELNSTLMSELPSREATKFEISRYSTEYIVPDTVLKLWKVDTTQEIRIKKE
jgi:hypothetical protein